MRKSILVVASLLTIVIGLVLHSCSTPPSSGEVVLNVADKSFDLLSKYHFFEGTLNDLKPNVGVLPYDLASPLFTDYAHKARFVYVPKGKQVDYQEEGVLNLPVGSCYIKNFYYPFDFRDLSKGRRIIETRMLVHRENGWESLSYIWKDDQSDATLEVAGDIKQVSWIHDDGKKMDIDYVIPNKNQCKGCHWDNKNNAFMPIGPKVRNLNHDYAYTDGVKNQMEKWTAVGILKGAKPGAQCPKMVSYYDTTATVNDRARAYLEINCAHCHNPNGPAYTSGLYVNLENSNPENLGICKAPVAAGIGTGNRMWDIVPGNHNASILSYRMESVEAGVKMPEVGRVLAHKEGVALINRWIDEMKAGECGVKQ